MNKRPRQYGTSNNDLGPDGKVDTNNPRWYYDPDAYAPGGPLRQQPQHYDSEPTVRNNSKPAPTAAKNVGQIAKPTPSKIKLPAKTKPKVPDDTQYHKTLQDFLTTAQQLLSGTTNGQLNALGNQEAALKNSAADIQNKMRGGYAGLSSFISGQAAPIGEAYQQGIQGAADAAKNAQDTIQAGTSAAQAQQQAILNRLGIADANIPIANTGTSLEADSARAISDSAQRAQNAQTQLSANKASGLTYNAALGNSAALEGQGQQDRISRDLMQKLAELADQRAVLQSSSASDALSLASELYNSDRQNWSDNYNRKYQANSDAMQFAIDQANASAEANSAPQMSSTAYSALGPLGQASYAMDQWGVDPSTAKATLAVISEVTSNGNQRIAMNPAAFIQAVQDRARQMGLDPITTQNAAMIYFNYLQ